MTTGAPANVDEPIRHHFAAALLAGGKSSRMGCDKSLLDWHGTPLWRAQLAKLIELNPDRILLSRREDQDFKTLLADHVVDPPDNPGPLPAIARCLELVNAPLLVLAVDMPQMTTAFMQIMLDEAASSSRGLICRTVDGLEPLCAVYPPDALPLMHEMLTQTRRMRSLAERLVADGLVRVRDLRDDEVPLFFNANTPEEYAWTKPAPPASN
jgi:molybdenum cofactor guanylyltransferase